MLINFDKLPDKIKRQIVNITKYSQLDFSDESVEKITILWLKKEKIFINELKMHNMIEAEYIDMDNPAGAIILTYSGSLLKLGTAQNGIRRIEYTSIGLRKDVPDNLIIENAQLNYDIIKDEPVDFIKSKIKTTSPVYKIGICEDSALPEQNDTIDEISDLILHNFIDLNRNLEEN